MSARDRPVDSQSVNCVALLGSLPFKFRQILNMLHERWATILNFVFIEEVK